MALPAWALMEVPRVVLPRQQQRVIGAEQGQAAPGATSRALPGAAPGLPQSARQLLAAYLAGGGVQEPAASSPKAIFQPPAKFHLNSIQLPSSNSQPVQSTAQTAMTPPLHWAIPTVELQTLYQPIPIPQSAAPTAAQQQQQRRQRQQRLRLQQYEAFIDGAFDISELESGASAPESRPLHQQLVRTFQCSDQFALCEHVYTIILSIMNTLHLTAASKLRTMAT